MLPRTTDKSHFIFLEKLDSPPTERGRLEHAELMSSLSTLYANLLVVIGVAVPVTASVSEQVPAALDQGFYLFLYLGSVAFVALMYGTLLRDKALNKMIVKHVKYEHAYAFVENGSASAFQVSRYVIYFCCWWGKEKFDN